MIPFNKPFLCGKETEYILSAVNSGKISGDGVFTKKCHSFFKEKFGFKKCLLTTSCTDALEMSALLIEIKPGDEVIIPSFTFVSTANAFVLHGATVVFADSSEMNPNMDVALLEKLITPRTKAVVVVHYAGIACDMDPVMKLAEKHGLYVIEDAAQSIDSYYKGRPLGSIGHLSAFSFHETKNIISGEGGMLVINDVRFEKRAEILWEKGTNRSAFWRGEVDKYGWIDVGSSFLPSDIIAAFLFAQLENLDIIQEKRKQIWQYFWKELSPLAQSGVCILPNLPDYASNNAHMFYLVLHSGSERDKFIEYMKKNGIGPVFHYQSLHKSVYYQQKNQVKDLPNSDRYSDCLVRLPLYFELSASDMNLICETIHRFFTASVS